MRSLPWTRAGRPIGTVAVVLMSLFALDAGPARGFAQDENGCHDDTIHWSFSNVFETWPSGKKELVRASLENLQGPEDWNDNPLVWMTEDGGIDVQLKDAPPANLGSSECLVGASFWINKNYSSDTFVYRTARHEMMHLIGAQHNGQYDDRQGENPPTMATCIPHETFTNGAGTTHDDKVVLNWLHSDVTWANSGPWENSSLTSNSGFSNAATTWKTDQGDSTLFGGSGGYHYAPSGRWESHGHEHEMFQAVRLIQGDDDANYRAIYATRKADNQSYSNSWVELYTRTVILPSNSSNNACAYADGIKNPNGETTEGQWALRANTNIAFDGGAWTNHKTAWIDPGSDEVYDLKIQIRGYASNSNGAQPIWLDEIAIEGT